MRVEPWEQRYVDAVKIIAIMAKYRDSQDREEACKAAKIKPLYDDAELTAEVNAMLKRLDKKTDLTRPAEPSDFCLRHRSFYCGCH